MILDAILQGEELDRHIGRIRRIMKERRLNPDYVKGIKNDDDTWDPLPLEKFLIITDNKGRPQPSRISEILASIRIDRGPQNMSLLTYKNKLDILVEYLIETIFEIASIYLDDTKGMVYLFDGNRVLSGEIDKDTTKLFSYISREFNIRSDERTELKKRFFEKVRNEAPKVTIYHDYHFDIDDKKLYVHNLDQVLVLDGNEPNVIRHGRRSIIFADHQHYQGFNLLWPKSELNMSFDPDSLNIRYPYDSYDKLLETVKISGLKTEIGDDVPNNPLFDLARRCNFKNGVLTKRQQIILYYLVMHMFPFVDATISLPFLNFIGPWGSGKTTAGRQLLKLLYGPEAEATKFDNDERTFQSNLADETFILYDNVEFVEDWFLDFVAALTTGTRMKKRRMHTNYENDEFRPHSLVGVTCETPSWDRSDIAERTLPFYFGSSVKDNGNVIPETEMYKPFSEFRDELLTIYYNNINLVVAKINERGGIVGTSDHRLAETAILLEIINEALEVCDTEEFKIIMDGLKVQRSTFALQEKSWWDPLIFTAKLNDQVEFTADELLEKFREHGYQDSKRRLFVDLSSYQQDIRHLFGYERKNTSMGPIYSFNKSKSTQYQWEGAFIYDPQSEPTINTNGHLHAVITSLKKGIKYPEPDLEKIILDHYSKDEVSEVLHHLLSRGELERVPVKDLAGNKQYRRP